MRCEGTPDCYIQIQYTRDTTHRPACGDWRRPGLANNMAPARTTLVALVVCLAKAAALCTTALSRALCIVGSSYGPGDKLGDGPANDAKQFGQMLWYQKGVAIRYAPVPEKGRARHDTLALIHSFFAQPAPRLNIIYFSGHGEAGSACHGDAKDDTRGGLSLEYTADRDQLSLSELRSQAARRRVPLHGHRGHKQTYIDALRRDELLTLGDILECWEAALRVERRDLSTPPPRLLLVADACYSGKLVARLRNRPVEGVAIQSAGNARQTVGQPRYVFTHAGIKYADVGRLTAYLTSSLHKEDARVRWSQEGQYPQFYATWDPEAAEKPSVALDLGTGFALRTVNRPDRR